MYNTWGISKRGTGYQLTMDDWAVTISPRLGLHQITGHHYGGLDLTAKRSVFEYAIEIHGGGRKRWVGNWHKFDLPAGIRLQGNSLRRKSLLMNPFKPWQALAGSEVTYTPGADGLEITTRLSWRRSVHRGLHYVAMLPLGVPLDHAEVPVLGMVPLGAGDGKVHGRAAGTTVSAKGVVTAALTVDGVLAVQDRAGGTKLYAGHHEAGQPVAAGTTETSTAVYAVIG